MTQNAPAAPNAAPAGSQAPAPAPASSAAPAAPAASTQSVYGKKGVYLADLPVIGAPQQPPQPDGKPAPAVEPPAVEPAAPENGDAVTDPENPAPDAAAAGAELVAVNGRKFTDPKELLASYNASTTEAQRLYAAERTAASEAAAYREQMEAANAALMELHGQVGAGAFPGLKLADGTVMTEVTAQTDEETRINFYGEKRDWMRKQEDLKKSLASAKDKAAAYATQVREQMAEVDKRMTAEVAKFPDYVALKDIREDVLKSSPFLANKPETPYITYLIAMGVRAMTERQAVAEAEAESKRQAAATAAGAAASSQGAGLPPAGARGSKPKNDGLDTLVKSYKGKTAYR